MDYFCLSHNETREELKMLINMDITRIQGGVSPKDIYDEIGRDYEIYLGPIYHANVRFGKHCRALAYACIDLGITNVEEISGWVAAEYYDILEKDKSVGSK